MRDIPPGLITVPLRRLALAAAIATVTFDGVSAQSPPTFVPAGASLGESTSYRLNPGDVLEISVRGFSELRQRGVIELDGEVSLPLAGRIAVADKTIAEAQAQIVRLATAKPVRQKTADGREALIVLTPDDVNVAVVEYRPVYALGDVAKPGELPFRPGLTARQAIALAGGFDVMRYRLVNPFLESADMKARQETLWTDIAKVRILVARLQAELDGRSSLDPAALRGIPLDPEFIARIFATESELLKRRSVELATEEKHLSILAQLAEERHRTLNATLANERAAEKEDSRALAELLEFSKRGAVPILRMVDMRRNAFASSSRVLQANAQHELAGREREEAIHKLERLSTTRRTDLLKEMQEAEITINSLQAQLSANAEKLEHTSLLQSRLVRGPGASVGIRLFRADHGAQRLIEATENTSLRPGDTIEISLQSAFDVEMSRGRRLVGNLQTSDPAR